MKKICFVIPTLEVGGAEKSLVSLLNELDYSKYEVDLILFAKRGAFITQIPPQVTVIEIDPVSRALLLEVKYYITELLSRGRLDLIFKKVLFSRYTRQDAKKGDRYLRNWDLVKGNIKPIKKQYDVGIAYLEGLASYFLIDKVKASTKALWVHNDYKMINNSPATDYKYFSKARYIATISDSCRASLNKYFPDMKEKIVKIENIVSPELIRKLGSEPIEEEYFFQPENVKRIISVGRLEAQKGYDIAIEACRILNNKEIKVKWYVLGEGSERSHLEQKIKQYRLQDSFVLLGIRNNPYKYMKASDIFVQSSRYEGKSVALDEAKILGMPIIVTNYSTASDQIIDSETGIIVDMNPEGVAEGICRLIEDKELRRRMVKKIGVVENSYKSELEKVYTIFES